MITIYNDETNAPVGELREGELQFLLEAAPQKTDGTSYVVTAETIETLTRAHADHRLLTALETALGTAEAVTIRWYHD